MKRMMSAVALAGALTLAGIVTAPAAYADVTNPADNPSPITVTGDDGLTYTDGQDTLPGYDDYACTYIPGAWFDFANNKVRYPDGQSIPWTEWDRASGYKDWLAKQSAPAPAAGTTTTTSSTSNTSTGGSSKPATGSQQGGAEAAPTAGAASAEPSASASADAEDEGVVALASVDATPSAEPVLVEAAGEPGTPQAGSSSAAGLAILGVLFGAGGLAFGVYTFVRGNRPKVAGASTSAKEHQS